jgi:hypothetical protein
MAAIVNPKQWQRQVQGESQDDMVTELRQMRAELRSLKEMFSEFAGTFLNAKFPYGKPTDRWARR